MQILLQIIAYMVK